MPATLPCLLSSSLQQKQSKAKERQAGSPLSLSSHLAPLFIRSCPDQAKLCYCNLHTPQRAATLFSPTTSTGRPSTTLLMTMPTRERGLERERDDGRAERRGNVERETAAGYKNETEMIHPSIHGAANLNWVGAPRKKREASEPGRTATGS